MPAYRGADPCPVCREPPADVIGRVAECGNDNCSVHQYAPFRSHDVETGSVVSQPDRSTIHCDDCETTAEEPLIPRLRPSLEENPVLCLKCYSFRVAT